MRFRNSHRALLGSLVLAGALVGASAAAQTDITGAPGVVHSARGGFASAGEGIAQAFDNSSATKWLDFSNQSWVQVDLPAGQRAVITSYTLTSANDSPQRDPRSWTLYGFENDFSAAVVLDQRSSGTAVFSARFQTRVYGVSGAAAYRRFRLVVANAGGSENIIQLAELELLEGASSPPDAGVASSDAAVASPDGGASPSGDLTSSPGCFLTARGENVSNPPYVEGRAQAVDDNTATKWLDLSGSTWITCELADGLAHRVDRYTLTSANDYPARDPAAWTLRGSNDGASWTTVDQRSGVTFASRFLTRSFTLPSAATFRYWRFDLTSLSGGITQLAELELLGAATQPDAGAAIDAGAPDSGATQPDASAADAGAAIDSGASQPDASAADATTAIDSGATQPDANAADATTAIDAGAPDSGATQIDAGAPDSGGAGGPPVYSGGNCPTLRDGTHSGFLSAGRMRSFELRLPDPNVARAPGILFNWHSYGGNPSYGLVETQVIHQAWYTDKVILVAPYPVTPYTSQNVYEWFVGTPPPNNPDLTLFDDVIACAYQQLGLDLNRVYSVGFSAGGVWTSYLALHRASRLAAAVAFSGGLQSPSQYTTPAADTPVLLVWGGTSDTYYQAGATFAYSAGDPARHSFDLAVRDLSGRLQTDGHFITECMHNGGHSVPPEASTGSGWPPPRTFLWSFVMDHVRGQSAEPYQTGLPGTFPSYCNIP